MEEEQQQTDFENPYELLVNKTDRLLYQLAKKEFKVPRFSFNPELQVVNLMIDVEVQRNENSEPSSYTTDLDLMIYVLNDHDALLHQVEELVQQGPFEGQDRVVSHLKKVRARTQQSWFPQVKIEFVQHEIRRFKKYQDLQKGVDQILAKRADDAFKASEDQFKVSGRGGKHDKKLPHELEGHIVSPPTLMRGTLSWYILRSKPETPYRFVRWPIQFDMADFIFQYSFLDFQGDMQKVQKLSGRIFQSAVDPFNRYCKAPGFERECKTIQNPVGDHFYNYLQALLKGNDKNLNSKLERFKQSKATTLHYGLVKKQRDEITVLLQRANPKVATGEGVRVQEDFDDIVNGNFNYREVVDFNRYQIFNHLKFLTEKQLQIQHRGEMKKQIDSGKLKPLHYKNYFASIEGLDDGCHSVTMSNGIISFAMISNWTMGNAVYQEKQFTLQMMALMHGLSPMVLVNQLENGYLSLEDAPYLVFDNDFSFYGFKLIHKVSDSEIQTRPYGDASEEALKKSQDRHLINLIQDRYLNHDDKGPWVVEVHLYKGDQSSKTSQACVIKIKEVQNRVAYPNAFSNASNGKLYMIVLLNIRGVTEIGTDFLPLNRYGIFGVFDGLFHYLSRHEVSPIIKRINNRFKSDNGLKGGSRYTYYSSCKVYTLAYYEDRSYTALLRMTAIRNLFYLFNRYQYYTQDIFYSCLWQSMFGIPTVDKGTKDQKSLISQMFANYSVMIDKRRFLNSLESRLNLEDFKLYRDRGDEITLNTYRQLTIVTLLRECGLLSRNNGLNLCEGYLLKIHSLFNYLKLRIGSLKNNLLKLGKMIDEKQVDQEFKDRVHGYQPGLLKGAIVQELELYQSLLIVVQTVVLRITQSKEQGTSEADLICMVPDSYSLRYQELSAFLDSKRAEESQQQLDMLAGQADQPDVITVQMQGKNKQCHPFRFYLGCLFSGNTLIKLLNAIGIQLKGQKQASFSANDKQLIEKWNKELLAKFVNPAPDEQPLRHYLYYQAGNPIIDPFTHQPVTLIMTKSSALARWCQQVECWIPEAEAIQNGQVMDLPQEIMKELFPDDLRTHYFKPEESDSDENANLDTDYDMSLGGEGSGVQRQDLQAMRQSASLQGEDLERIPSSSDVSASHERESLFQQPTNDLTIGSYQDDIFNHYLDAYEPLMQETGNQLTETVPLNAAKIEALQQLLANQEPAMEVQVIMTNSMLYSDQQQVQMSQQWVGQESPQVQPPQASVPILLIGAQNPLTSSIPPNTMMSAQVEPLINNPIQPTGPNLEQQLGAGHQPVSPQANHIRQVTFAEEIKTEQEPPSILELRDADSVSQPTRPLSQRDQSSIRYQLSQGHSQSDRIEKGRLKMAMEKATPLKNVMVQSNSTKQMALTQAQSASDERQSLQLPIQGSSATFTRTVIKRGRTTLQGPPTNQLPSKRTASAAQLQHDIEIQNAAQGLADSLNAAKKLITEEMWNDEPFEPPETSDISSFHPQSNVSEQSPTSFSSDGSKEKKKKGSRSRSKSTDSNKNGTKANKGRASKKNQQKGQEDAGEDEEGADEEAGGDGGASKMTQPPKGRRVGRSK